MDPKQGETHRRPRGDPVSLSVPADRAAIADLPRAPMTICSVLDILQSDHQSASGLGRERLLSPCTDQLLRLTLKGTIPMHTFLDA